MKDTINRKPTYEEKIKALKENSQSNNYEWSGKHRGSCRGLTLWKSLVEDAQHSSSQRISIFEQWGYDRADELYEDADYQNEYRKPDLWKVYVVIGNKGRKVFIGDVVAKTDKEAVSPTNEIVQNAGSEFLGLKYIITAEPYTLDEQMTDKEFREMCHTSADDDANDIENMIEDINDDKQVAEFFDIEYEIIEWDCENPEINCTDGVVAICDCGYPLCKDDMAHPFDDVDDFPGCRSCGADLRTVDEIIVDAI